MSYYSGYNGSAAYDLSLFEARTPYERKAKPQQHKKKTASRTRTVQTAANARQVV